MTAKRKMMIILSFILMVLMGTLYSWSLFRVEVETRFDLTAVGGGVPYMVSLFFYAISMMITGRVLNNRNTVRITVMGLILIAIGWLGASRMQGLFSFTLFYGVFNGFGVGMVYGVPLYILQREIPSRSGFYGGIILSGFGASPFFGAPLVSFLRSLGGLETTFLVFAFIVALMIAPAALLFRTDKFKSESQPISVLPDRTFFIVLYVLFLIATLVGLMMIGLSYRMGTINYGFQPAAVTALMSLFALCNGAARPLFGLLMDKKGLFFAATLSLSSIALAAFIALVNRGESLSLYGLSFSIFWLNLGAWLAMMPQAIRHYFGTESYARTFGMLFTAYGFGAIGGTILSGYILEIFPTTANIYALTVLVVLIAFVFLAVAKKLSRRIF